MPTLTRRGFFEISSGAALAAALNPQAPRNGQPARIYTVFFDIAPSRDDSALQPLTNDDILRRLRTECPGVEFVVRDLTRGVRLPAVLQEARDLRQLACDGVILYGWPRDNDLLRTGLPTINVAVLNDFMNIPYPLFRQNRVVAAMLDPWRFSADPKVSERMFTDLADQIKLIRALKCMKSERILSVTDSPYVNVMYGDVLKSPPPRYNETILEAILQTFGTQVTKISSKEVTEDPDIQKLWNSDSPEANQLAQRWIAAAQKMTYTIPSEVVKSAKLYLAMRHLMRKYGATALAFHIRSLIKNPRPEDYVYPAIGVSEAQLENIVLKCQSHLNIVLSEMLLQYAYGRPSMLGDYSVDTYHNTSCVQHCAGPWNPWGDNRRVPYILTDHRERRVRARNQPGVGAGLWVLYPPNEPVTMWQIDVLSREILFHTGRTVHMLTGPVHYRDHLWEMM
jgi:hypothetical protein